MYFESARAQIIFKTYLFFFFSLIIFKNSKFYNNIKNIKILLYHLKIKLLDKNYNDN